MEHQNPQTIHDIFGEVQSNLYDSGLKWHTSQDILDAIQEVYNKVVAILCPIERSTFIPQIAQPYYDLAAQIPDYMYVSGIFNPITNLWLEGLTYKQMKATYQTYLAIGAHKWINVVDMRRVLLWPYAPGASGVLYVLYKASAPDISMAHIPHLPYSVGPSLLEYLATAELLEQAREFRKAQLWANKALDKGKAPRSLWDQCKMEIQNLARVDREMVLEPYRWIFHGGQFSVASWINNETPSGTINGTNATFTLAQTPSPTSSLLLTKNGTIQYSGTAYSLSGQTCTFNSGYIPQVGDQLRAWYQVA